MKRWIWIVAAACLIYAAPAVRAENKKIVTVSAGESRLALVIGNAAYFGPGVQALVNPINDANAMAAALRKMGFTVTELTDANRDAIRDGVHAFTHSISESGKDVVALLYFSGHGMQIAGKNYIVPIGFKTPPTPDDMDDYAYPMQKALDEMQQANARTNIVILDACRNNPYDGERGIGGKGLARMEASGVFVAYATAEGKTADDNSDSKNGLYTQALLKAMQQPGSDIHQVFMATKQAVVAESKGSQYPYDYDGLLSDDFYFSGRPEHITPALTPTPSPAPSPKPVTVKFETANDAVIDGYTIHAPKGYVRNDVMEGNMRVFIWTDLHAFLSVTLDPVGHPAGAADLQAGLQGLVSILKTKGIYATSVDAPQSREIGGKSGLWMTFHGTYDYGSGISGDMHGAGMAIPDGDTLVMGCTIVDDNYAKEVLPGLELDLESVRPK